METHFAHKVFHPLIRALCPLLRKFPIRQYSANPIKQSSPVVFVCNHSNMHDIPIAIEIIKRQVYVLLDDEPRKSIAGIAFSVNGAVWVNRNSKESRAQAMQTMQKHLQKGHDLLLFPEGTWNTTDCLPMLPMSWSVVRLARDNDCPIVPITLEYPDFTSCYYCVGEPLQILKDENDKEAINRLRDAMATMRWRYWSEQAQTSRSAITKYDHDIYSVLRHKEFRPKDYKMAYEREKAAIRYPYTTPQQAYAYMKRLIPSHANAFLFNKHNEG